MTETVPRRPIRSWIASRPYHLASPGSPCWPWSPSSCRSAGPAHAPNETPLDHPPGLSEDRAMPATTSDKAEPMRGTRRARIRTASPPCWAGATSCGRTFREISVDRLPAVAGGVTFYTLLAIFPAIERLRVAVRPVRRRGRGRSSYRRCRASSPPASSTSSANRCCAWPAGSRPSWAWPSCSACCCRSGAPTPA